MYATDIDITGPYRYQYAMAKLNTSSPSTCANENAEKSFTRITLQEYIRTVYKKHKSVGLAVTRFDWSRNNLC
jgi:hypothetical protein